MATKKIPHASRLLLHSKLATLLLPCEGLDKDRLALCDGSLFGGFATDEDGKPQFKDHTRMYVFTKRIRSLSALDTMLLNLFVAAANHARQFKELTFCDVGYGIESYWVARASRRRTSVLWGGFYITIDGSPRDVGRLCFEGERFGAAIYGPGRVGVVKFR